MRIIIQGLAIILWVYPALLAADGSRKPSVVNRTPGVEYGIHAAGATAEQKGVTTGDEIPGKPEILSLLRKVNSYQLEHPYVDAWEAAHPIDAQRKRPWTRATWYTGVMAVWKATRDPAFLEQAIQYGRDLQWGVGEEQLGANRLFPIEIWTEIYFVKKDRSMIEPGIKWLATPDPLTPAGRKRWYLDGRDSFDNHPVPYIDSTYGAPALAMLAKATGDEKYLDIMRAFLDDVTGELLDQETGLFYRDTRFIGQRNKNGKKILWARGNGWVFAGIARVLDYLPKNDPSREHYLALFRRQAAALVQRQGTDGLWRENLDDPEEFPGPETSGSGFFCFGLAWGINNGVLDRQQYLPAVKKAWHGLTQSLSPEGKVLWGQLVDDQPHTTARDSTHEYVTGTFLLAGSEVYKLAPMQ
jgi:unsaturated rhamnogalacturonyl hydrolase